MPTTRSKAKAKDAKRSGADTNEASKTKKKKKTQTYREQKPINLEVEDILGDYDDYFFRQRREAQEQRIKKLIEAAERIKSNKNTSTIDNETLRKLLESGNSHPNQGRVGMPPFYPPQMAIGAAAGSTQSTNFMGRNSETEERLVRQMEALKEENNVLKEGLNNAIHQIHALETAPGGNHGVHHFAPPAGSVMPYRN